MTTVIVQQPGVNVAGYQQNSGQWSSGLCGCFDDITSCCYNYWCFPCHVCSMAEKMNENCACLLGFCLGELAIFGMRTRVRTVYGIQGSICEDFCCAAYCPQLTACQIDRELKTRGTSAF